MLEEVYIIELCIPPPTIQQPSMRHHTTFTYSTNFDQHQEELRLRQGRHEVSEQETGADWRTEIVFLDEFCRE